MQGIGVGMQGIRSGILGIRVGMRRKGVRMGEIWVGMRGIELNKINDSPGSFFSDEKLHFTQCCCLSRDFDYS